MKIEESIQSYAISTEIKGGKEPDFDPTEFIGMLSHYNFDLEDELQQIRIFGLEIYFRY